MKKCLFSILIASLICFTAGAQEIRFGILAGGNLQNINGKDMGGEKLEYKLTPGYHAGINVLIPVAPEIYFQPGLLFSSKGALVDDVTDTKYRINYLEIPMNIVYRGQLGDNFVLLGLGPYVGYALGGKLVIGNTKTDLTFDNDILVWNPLVLRRFDAGANIFAGYELAGGIFLQVDAQLGLVKINPDADVVANDKRAWKHTGFGISVGYRF